MTTHFFSSNPGLRISRWFFGRNQKQTGDQGTFKLRLFAEGNGCSPDLMRTWILLSRAWNDARTAGKRSKQIDFIEDNLEQKKASWSYFDINYGKLLLLNGQPKNQKEWMERRICPLINIALYWDRIHITFVCYLIIEMFSFFLSQSE